jgi:Flp pilus assembly protein TadG
VLLLFGIMEFGRFVAVYSGVQTASREAARYGSAVGDSGNGVPRYADCGEIRQAGATRSGLAGLAVADIVVTFDNGPGTGVTATCPSSGNIDPADVAAGDRIVVTATTTYNSFAPFFGSREITATDRRTIFKP